jgi:hypothetical protein
MQDKAQNSIVIELSNGMSWQPGVCFDPQEITLEGAYFDEISAYRAKRVWTSVLESSFLLESRHDFTMTVARGVGLDCYVLRCDFTSACGRYAFWRLTHNQAPEAQYVIETAHIPNAEAHHRAFLNAPDLRAVDEPSMLFQRPPGLPGRGGVTGWIGSLLGRLLRRP